MKRLLPAAISLLLLATTTFGQQLDPLPQPGPQTDYLKKSRSQKTAGFILLGVGLTGLLITATAEGTEEVANSLTTVFSLGTIEPPPPKSYTTPYVLSAACMAASVPLLSAAVRNKKKGVAQVSLQMHQGPRSVVVRNNAYPAIALHLGL